MGQGLLGLVTTQGVFKQN